MDIKCNLNPYYFLAQSPVETAHFRGAKNASKVVKRVGAELHANVAKELNADLCGEILIKRPVVSGNTTGLFDVIRKCKNSVAAYLKNYKKNIEHTFEHKMIFAIIEKKLFGNISIDTLTHDLDKLILYTLGFPKTFVTKFHRKISEHHVESGKKSNLRSMLCDNIASSPEFKPEKTKTLREHYKTSQELQKVKGFAEILEKYNYGENLDFNLIKMEKDVKFSTYNGTIAMILNLLAFIFSNAKIHKL